MFERFGDDARRVVVLAQEDARLLHHNYIGTEHLLLASLRDEVGGLAMPVLRAAGITYERAREEIVEIVGSGGGTSAGHIPFTRESKHVLEMSLREALENGDDEIRSEHILLALLREETGVGTQVLVALGADLPPLRVQLIGARGRQAPGPRRAVARGAMSGSAMAPSARGIPGGGRPVLRCSLCGRSEDKVAQLLVAGGTVICDKCARDAAAQIDALPEDAPKRVRFRRPDVDPSDKVTATRAIERAFEAVIGPAHLAPEEALWAVEGGADIEALLRQLDEDSRYAPVVVNDVTVERVRFLESDEAEVSLGIWMAGSSAPMLQAGHAVLVDGTWKVSTATLEFYAALAHQHRRPG